MSVFGIMTHDLRRPHRYDPYAREARRLGFEAVLLFAPDAVDLSRRRVRALRSEGDRWRPCTAALPDIAHDMGFYTDPGTIRRVKAIKSAASGLPFTGYALGHKWKIHKMLQRTAFASHLPETCLLRSPRDAVSAARRFGAVMVKPRDGKQGKGIVKIAAAGGKWLWKEQHSRAEALSEAALTARLAARFRPGKAVVQRWMDIRCPQGGVFDIRVLMQRAGDGAWRRTATAVRQSGVSQIASNVTGGGAVRDAEPFLTRMYGEAAARILEEIRRVAEGLPAALEAQYGRRFAELGIDLAVERGGAVRIIEVNIKPGKKIVRALHGDRAYADALLAPVRWARRLSDRRDCPSTGS